jgi:heme-degrading monooxygenase HmoA
MFARIVTIPLKAGSRSEYGSMIQKSVVPLLRSYKGFLDHMGLVSLDGKTSVGISLWDSRESAEAYSRSGFSEVMKALEQVAAGPPQVQLCDVTNSTAHKIAAAAGA